MGRQIKRVALDFDWPLNQVWKGYVCPYNSVECPYCEGTGYNPEAKKLEDEWYAFDNPRYVSIGNGRQYNANAWCHNLDKDDIQALLDADRLWDFTRRPINDKQRADVEAELAKGKNSWLPYDNGYKPTPKEVNKWSQTGFGHDSLNEGIVISAKCKRLGIKEYCEHCDGEGSTYATKEIRTLANHWRSKEPPKGVGWQLWETVSEGSPITPVFATKEELVDYMVKGDGWKHKWTRNQAEAMVEEGWTMSGLSVGGKFMNAQEAVEYSHEEKVTKKAA